MSFRHFSADSVPNQGYITYNSYSWNKPVSITYPGGTKREYTYNPLMQIKSLTVKDPGQNPFMTYNYQYAPAGNISAKDTEHGNYSYQYDDLYRLTNADNATVQDEAYTYDAVGNRLTSANVTGAWSYNENNELLNYDGVSNEYDNNGNTTSKTEQTGTTIYTYDVENRLVQVSTPTQTITYYYDPLGRRLWKDISGNRTYFLYADEGLIGEYDTSGSEIKTYGYEPNSTWTTNPLFQKIGANYYWYQNDHLGTPQKLIDTSGRVVWSATYDSFGNIQIDVAEIENNLRFPGQYYDAETGLHYNYHRDYDPEIGRYVEADPIGIEKGENHLYVYVGNNPVNFTDPEGLHPIPIRCPKDPKELEKLKKEYCGNFYCCYGEKWGQMECWWTKCPSPELKIPSWLCKLGVKAVCNYLCMRGKGDFLTCQLKCTGIAEIFCPKICE